MFNNLLSLAYIESGGAKGWGGAKGQVEEEGIWESRENESLKDMDWEGGMEGEWYDGSIQVAFWEGKCPGDLIREE